MHICMYVSRFEWRKHVLQSRINSGAPISDQFRPSFLGFIEFVGFVGLVELKARSSELEG